eukprot:4399210-Amphidinium_carterae.1
MTSYLTESTTEAPTLLRSQVSTVYPTDSASRAGTRTIAPTAATPEVVLPTHDARDLEIARLTSIATALSQKKAQALTLLQKVEQEAARRDSERGARTCSTESDAYQRDVHSGGESERLTDQRTRSPSRRPSQSAAKKSPRTPRRSPLPRGSWELKFKLGA